MIRLLIAAALAAGAGLRELRKFRERLPKIREAQHCVKNDQQTD
jgi:hypothetical protein